MIYDTTPEAREVDLEIHREIQSWNDDFQSIKMIIDELRQGYGSLLRYYTRDYITEINPYSARFSLYNVSFSVHTHNPLTIRCYDVISMRHTTSECYETALFFIRKYLNREYAPYSKTIKINGTEYKIQTVEK